MGAGLYGKQDYPTRGKYEAEMIAAAVLTRAGLLSSSPFTPRVVQNCEPGSIIKPHLAQLNRIKKTKVSGHRYHGKRRK